MATKAAAAKTDLAERPGLTITRRFRAPPEEIYAAWTQADQLMRWFGPSSVKPGSVKADLDVRAGGRYRLSFTREDGEYCEVGGLYREVVPNERLVFSWAWHSTPERESLVTISFKRDGAGTLMVFDHAQFVDVSARDSHRSGWSSCFDRLDDYVA